MAGNTNDFVPFATGVGANVLAPGVWAGQTARTQGFVAGQASSSQANTAIRQASSVANMIAAFTADFGLGGIGIPNINPATSNVQDNGDLAQMESQFESALYRFLLNYFVPLTIALDYYFNPDTGSDLTGNGTSGSPWRAPQHGIDIVGKSACFGQVNFYLEPSSLGNRYTGFTIPSGLVSTWNFVGEPGQASNTVIDGTTGDSGGVAVQPYNNYVYMSGVTLISQRYDIYTQTGSHVWLGYDPVSQTQNKVVCELPTEALPALTTSSGSAISFWGEVDFTKNGRGGASNYGAIASAGGSVYIAYHDTYITHAATINFNAGSSSITYSGPIVQATQGGLVNFSPAYTTISPSTTPTGQRWLTSSGGNIAFNGGGVNYIPGTIAGTNNPGAAAGPPVQANSGFYSV